MITYSLKLGNIEDKIQTMGSSIGVNAYHYENLQLSKEYTHTHII